MFLRIADLAQIQNGFSNHKSAVHNIDISVIVILVQA